MLEAFHLVIASVSLVFGLIGILLVRSGMRLYGSWVPSILSASLAALLAMTVVADIWLGDGTEPIVARVLYIVALTIWSWVTWPRGPRKRKKWLREAGAKAKAILAKLIEQVKSMPPVRAPLPNPS